MAEQDDNRTIVIIVSRCIAWAKQFVHEAEHKNLGPHYSASPKPA